MTQKWYATLRHPKMYPHTKFGIPISKNIGDMDRTRRRDGRTDGRTDSAITICLPKFLWGHKKIFRQKNAIFYDKKVSCMMLLREKHYYTDELVYLTYYSLDKFKKEDV